MKREGASLQGFQKHPYVLLLALRTNLRLEVLVIKVNVPATTLIFPGHQQVGLLEGVSLRKRVYSSLGYLPPAEFEAAWQAQ